MISIALEAHQPPRGKRRHTEAQWINPPFPDEQVMSAVGFV
jgi:hypothetical protein